MVKKIIRVPEKLYIQTLIAGGFKPEMVLEDCKLHNIELDLATLAPIVDQLRETSANLQFDDIELEDLQLSPMYYYRFKKPAPAKTSIDGCEGAFEILADSRLRKIITALALSGINPMDIELLVNGRYEVSHDSPDFQNFLKYFANFEEWGYADREFFVESQRDAEFKMILKKAALKGDRHYLVWKLGLGTDPHMSLEQVFSDMLSDAYFTFKENVRLRPDDAQKFAQLALKIADRLDSSDARKKESHNLLDELKIKLVVENTSDKTESKITDISEVPVELPKRGTGGTSIALDKLKFE